MLRIAADPHDARGGVVTERARELGREDARHDERRVGLRSLAGVAEDAEDVADAEPADLCQRHDATLPRAWIDCRTPIASRFATIDDPPTVTNASGMPVTGATPIVIPTLTNTWKRNANTMPPATTALK